MKRYSDELVKKLGEEKEIIQSYGTEVIFKESPVDGRKGYMDPYEIKALENQQEHVGEEKCNEISLEKLAQRMRDSMGYPNLNLNETEIITKCESLVLEKNNVEIWRYYKRRTEKKERPALVMIHGGGWIGGSVSVLENYCKLVAERADAVVFSIEYNKGPEKPFPNAQNDCFNCLKHIYENYEKYGIDKNRIAVGGDSAGGNLALSTAIKARNSGLNWIKALVLAYPCTVKCDATMDGYVWSEDVYDFSEEQGDMEKKLINLGHMVKYGEDPIELMTMKNPQDVYNPIYSPMMDPDKSNMPYTLMISCEYDGLRQQDEFYVIQLRKAGNKAKCIRYGGISHAIIDRLGHVPQAEDIVNETVNIINEL